VVDGITSIKGDKNEKKKKSINRFGHFGNDRKWSTIGR
jgi:hypothetical protein